MSAVGLKTLDGNQRSIPDGELDGLRSGLRGALFLPGDPGYDGARVIWNAMIDRRPAAIVRAAGAADVMRAVTFARQHGLLLAVRGGGHNIAGNAVVDGGLMLDLSAMKSVRIDAEARTARVEPGVTLGELDREAQAFGLATPLGINSTTGVAGVTLGGGFGWISRRHGLTVDNLLSADVVTADGRLVRAGERENPDLYWAIRGGGGNFGVVTSFEYRLHPIGPQVTAGLIVHPLSSAREVLEGYRRFTARWGDPAQDAACMTWARRMFEAAAAYATGGVYVNFMPGDEAQRVSSGAYGVNFARLAKLKAKYDPANLFRVNQNIEPAH
jgi:FAD/FMN-containing dehydrogenase